MNKKGFTLIELLAVIVILAVIALIVTPIVTGIIAQAKESANARSVEGHVKNFEYAMLEAAFKDGSGNTSAFNNNGTAISYTDLVALLTAKGISLPDNDHIKCTNYTISEGTVMTATGCAEFSGETNAWGKTYYFAQGHNAVVETSTSN